MLVRAAVDKLEVVVREARDEGKKCTRTGVYLNPGSRMTAPLPLAVRRGKATFGIHTEDDRLSGYPRMEDGQIDSTQLLQAAAEWDAEPGRWTATDFVRSLLPEIHGTDEYDQYLEARSSLFASGRIKGDD